MNVTFFAHANRTFFQTSQTRDLTVSATLKGCSLINIETLAEKLLTGNDSFTLDAANDKGYSIRCDISTTGRLSRIKFSYDGEGHVESNSPYYMFGNSAAGSIINAVDYLSTCGRKVVKVQGFLHDKMSFEKYFNINVKKASGASCDSGSPSAPSPVRAPVPISPVIAPVAPSPVGAPVVPVVPSPVGAPVAPVAPSPVGAPVVPVAPSPVGAPVVPVAPSPVGAPVAPVAPSPVGAPVAPVAPSPVGAPVAPVAPSPIGAPVAPIAPLPVPAPVASPVLAPVPVRAPKGVPAPVPVSVPVAPVTSPVLAPVPVRAPKGVPAPVPVSVPVRAPKSVPVPVPVPVSCRAQVTGYTLVNAESNRDIMPLRSYVMSDVPESLSIRVDIRACSPKVVESVYIDFDGMTRCENFAPYTVFGDLSSQDLANNMADYNGKAIKAGHHVIKATPYTKDKCQGTAGNTHTLEFNVEEEIPYV